MQSYTFLAKSRDWLIGHFKTLLLNVGQRYERPAAKMRSLFKSLVFAASLVGGSAAADSIAVVELYTSQGCSSCPPADEMLSDLAKRDDIIALALHVDYWDYIGWVDDLANPAFTTRQRAFARAKGSRTVYTPQMIFGGVDHVVGSRPMEVMDQVQAHASRQNEVSVHLSRSGDTLRIDADRDGSFRGNAVVQIVRYTPSVTRDIRRGENAGRTIVYSNVVTSWFNAGTWNVQQPLAMQAQISGTEPVVVIVQDGTDGPILGSAVLR